MPMLLGAIADDFTGATDLANTLVRRGLRTVQLIGLPQQAPPAAIDAVVIALKSRTIPAAEAVAQSRAALDWLRAAETRQILFKYCSTFDSTDHGNIGPVADALLEALGRDRPQGRRHPDFADGFLDRAQRADPGREGQYPGRHRRYRHRLRELRLVHHLGQVRSEDAMLQHLAGKTPPKEVLVPIIVVTNKNLDQVLPTIKQTVFANELKQ
jgi:hypothetical protein